MSGDQHGLPAELRQHLSAVEADLAELDSAAPMPADAAGRVAALARTASAAGAANAQQIALSMASYLRNMAEGAVTESDRNQLHLLLDNLRRALLREPEPAEEAQAPALIAPIAPSQDADSNQVALYVESRAIAALLEETLVRAGYSPRRIAAMRELADDDGQGCPAAIIADLSLCRSDADSRRIVQALRERAPSPPHLFCLAGADDMQARLEAVRLGATRFIRKPVDCERLVAILNGVTARSPAEPFRALLVDDDRALTELYAAALSEAGVVVRTCNRPLEAPALVAGFRPDVIVTDVYMPGCNGLELAALLRQDGELTDTPILFLSSETDIQRQLKALDLGADDFLSKPIPLEVLQTAVLARAKRARMLKRSRNEWRRAVEQLKAAKDQVEAASRAKSEFLSSVSHELRTPLSIIMSFGQLLDMGVPTPLPEAHRDAVQHILGAGRQLQELIGEVLDLTRIEANRLDLTLETFALEPLVSNLATQFSTQMAARHIDFQMVGETGLAVCADVGRVRQVLLNLISNAVKYNCDCGLVTVSFRLVKGYVRISVGDTGPGIPDDRRAELFQPFSRLGAEKTGVEGTGIGLVVCRKLVEAMDGRIGFDSIVGGGSTFWVELPAAPGGAGEGAAAATAAHTADLDEACARILYVEDNLASVRAMRQILAPFPGIRLDVIGSAEEALNIMRRTLPELVLMDIHLPGMSGLDAIRAAKADPRIAGIPVVAVSAAAMSGDVAAGLQAGFLAYVTKPLHIPEFLALIGKVLKGEKP